VITSGAVMKGDVSTLVFDKYEGLGNDFIVIDAARQDDLPVETARRLCDRRRGVGGDGVLLVLPPDDPAHAGRMVVINADGSIPQMCGNGIRCVAKELFDRGGLAQREILIETGAGVLACHIDASGGHAEWVTVAMGAPRLLRAEIPMTGPAGERCIAQPLELPGEPARTVTAVSMGNPHAITFVDSRDEAWRLAKTVGPTVERHAWFPARTNAEFAHVRDRRAIDLVVWERGCGITLACGTGACATTVAAILTGAVDENVPVELRLPGGAMTITVLPRFENVHMRGPAAHVFDATIDPVHLVRRPA
jgi:diaminopimelate epimerase